MVDPDLLELMPDTVTILKKTAQNRFTEDTLTASITARAQVRQKPSIVRRTDGSEIKSMTTIILDDTYGLTPEDRIVLPDGTSPAVLEVTKHQDETGHHHETVRTV